MSKRDADVVETSETLLRIKDRIPREAYPILVIYIEETRPQEYIDKYGVGTPRASHIAEFLLMSLKEVKRLLGIIKMQCLAAELGF
jgi:hypothetical protein